MIKVKTPEEIEKLAIGGKLLGQFLDELEEMAKPGVSGSDLEKRARELCDEHDVRPAFLNYASGGHDPFPAATCVSVNDGVVHGMPTSEIFEEGDLVGIDLGIVYEGLYLDSARTAAVGEISDESKELLRVTRESMQKGIEAAQLGNTTGDIGAAIQEYIESQGEQYGIVRELVGHGVGYEVHEEPQVPNFGVRGQGAELTEGLVIAIEPMVTIGDPAIGTASDGWTIVTKSGHNAAHFEHTVAITKDGPRILTAS